MTGTTKSLSADVGLVRVYEESQGISLNSQCELIASMLEIVKILSAKLPGTLIINPQENIFLGIPLGFKVISFVVKKKVDDLRKTQNKMNIRDILDAILLLTWCLFNHTKIKLPAEGFVILQH